MVLVSLRPEWIHLNLKESLNDARFHVKVLTAELSVFFLSLSSGESPAFLLLMVTLLFGRTVGTTMDLIGNSPETFFSDIQEVSRQSSKRRSVAIPQGSCVKAVCLCNLSRVVCLPPVDWRGVAAPPVIMTRLFYCWLSWTSLENTQNPT